MDRRTADIMLIATGAALWWVGAKTFADYHENVALGVHDSFQQRHATAIGSILSLGGLGLAVYGTYKIEPTIGKFAGLGLGALVAYNYVQHRAGEPLISLSPLTPRLHA